MQQKQKSHRGTKKDKHNNKMQGQEWVNANKMKDKKRNEKQCF